MVEEFLQEIKESKHTDDPHDSANKESIDGYITQPKVERRKVAKMIYKDRKWIEVDEELPRINDFIWFFGVVEDRNDPVQLGRLRVRCYGWHTDDKNEIPTDSLPWAIPIQDVTSAASVEKVKSPTESLKDRGLLDSSQTERKHNNHT